MTRMISSARLEISGGTIRAAGDKPGATAHQDVEFVDRLEADSIGFEFVGTSQEQWWDDDTLVIEDATLFAIESPAADTEVIVGNEVGH